MEGRGCPGRGSCGRAVHVVLVGTSVIKNTVSSLAECSSGVSEACDALGVEPREASVLHERYRACQRPKPGSEEDRFCGQEARVGRLGALARRYACTDPARASAELNAMLEPLECGCPGISRVVLLATDTETGYGAAEVLKGCIEEKCGVTVEIERVQGLGVDFGNGLINLMDKILSIANEAAGGAGAGGGLALNLNGGFKPESGFALLAGHYALTKGAAYYKHESLKETVVIPLVSHAAAAAILQCIRAGALSLSCAAEKLQADRDAYGFAAALASIAPRRAWWSGGCDSVEFRDGRLMAETRDSLSALARR